MVALTTASAMGLVYDSRHVERSFAESERPIVGTVLAESYQNTLSPVPKWNGFVSYSNETVKLDSKYTLKIQTDDGRILGISVIDGYDVKKESLDAIIEPGSRISFPTGNMRTGNAWGSGPGNRYYPRETNFTPETQAGSKRADRIKVVRF